MDLRQETFAPQERRDNIENPTVPVSSSNFLQFFGINGGHLADVTVDAAMTVPPVFSACTFLPATLAALPLHAFRAKSGAAAERISGGLDNLLGDAPNDEWTSFGWRQYFWSQVFTVGRGLSWIERSGTNIVGIWPMDANKTTVQRKGLKKTYSFGGQVYDSADIIDVPFMLRGDQLSAYGPIAQGAKMIQRAIAMMEYGASFFAGGGVPPLAVSGPMPAGPDAMKRASDDIMRAIKAAKKDDKPIVQLPAGYELKPIGFDPEKGQMDDSMRMVVEDVARIWGLPPVFLQDLTHGTFTNTEQQDLFFVKHCIRRWAVAFEQEVNLKLFGRKSNNRFAEHNLDGLMRGDLVARMTALAQGVNAALITPNEGRALDNRPAMTGGDKLYIQGATMPLESAGTNNGKTQPPPAA